MFVAHDLVSFLLDYFCNYVWPFEGEGVALREGVSVLVGAGDAACVL